jgi:type IV pilus assembly protein PilY1
MRTRTALRSLASLAVLVVLAAPHATIPQSCPNVAARTLLGGSLSEAFLNPSGWEDNQFFTSQAGFPNIFFLIDTSGSMARLPPNGPGFLASSGDPDPSVLPTGMWVPQSAQQYGTTGVGSVQVGCGPELEFGSLPSSPALSVVANRTYHSPCGGTDYENLPYQPYDPSTDTGLDYAHAASVCPYYTSANTFTTGVDGYDQDFYTPTLGALQAGSTPNFFARDLVFHDTVYNGYLYSRSGRTRGNGWDFGRVYPWQTSGGSNGSVAQFCTAQGTTRQPLVTGPTREAICNSCLTKRGWYYDGYIDDVGQDSIGHVRYPSLWYVGNYLNFFPPKFAIARRVVKDVISNQTRIRMAMAQFGSTGNWDGSGSWGYDFVRDFNPSCSSVFNNGNWEQNRGTYVNDVNTLGWGGGTPLASSFFDVARYYHTPTLPWFGSAWEKTQTSSPGPYESSGSANSLAVCWSCQSSSVIILTDGNPTPGDGAGFPSGPASLADSNSGKYAGATTTGLLGVSTADCPKCGDFTGGEDYKNNLTRAAWYFHNYDLRGETAGSCGGSGGTLDGMGMPGKQVLDLYTIGFGTSGLADATHILSNAADVGGGIFISADSADVLREGIFKVFQTINERSTSFSVATVSTLQTSSANTVIVPRFDPSREPNWAGHLYRFELYSEFVHDCTPNGVGDLDCDGACNSVFLVDKSGKFIAEDGNGHFIQVAGSTPLCAQVPLCVAQGKACSAFSDPPIPADAWWDAYNALQQQGWKTRSVWTVTDTAAPLGVLNQDDDPIQLAPTDDVATALLPYLGLGTNGGVCADIAAKLTTAGDSVTASIVRSSKLECTKTIIRFVLGADVFNSMGRKSPDWPPPRPDSGQPASATNAPDQDQLLDRAFKLGDVYHSSPVLVDPPLPADGFLCLNEVGTQCLRSLWLTPVLPDVSGTNPYDLYAKSTPYQNRRKMVLVGSNDGMLHAFNGGRWHPGGRDMALYPDIDTSLPPFNGYYDRGDEDLSNNGVTTPAPIELWAFIPPDLLGKLPQLLVGQHQIFVDGTAMVRDVWVDGAANAIVSSPATVDDLKSPSEFHTVAVVGERRGGNHYFALDVTDAAKTSSENGGSAVKPKFLWIYPQPTNAESLSFGETFDDFLPIPPPIGPVRIKADSQSGVATTNTPKMAVPGVASPVPYHEKWIALLSGGYDPQYLRGRGVHMVDIWTGKELFDFSYDPNAGSTDPHSALEYPIAAVQGMVMWGNQQRRPSLGFENQGYFDTATFGDTGGQLWVLRFNVPGELDSTTGKVGNWFGARVFEMGSGGGSLCNRAGGNPFFWITANTALPNSHLYRVFAGTGDRFNLLDTNGGTCGPDNLRACAQLGCSVTLSSAGNTYAMADLGSDGRSLTQTACGSGAQGDFTESFDPSGVWTACGTKTDANVVVSCPNSLSFTKNVAVTCTQDGAGDFGCDVGNSTNRTSGAPSYGTQLTFSSQSFTSYPMSRNWYFGLRVFDDTGDRQIFTDASSASKYDAARYKLVDNVTAVSPVSGSVTITGGWVAIDGASNAVTKYSDEYSPGWGIYYDHPGTITTEGHTYTVNLIDERTSSTSALRGMLTWHAIQAPLGEAQAATAGCAQSKCTAAFRRVSYQYGADPTTAAPFLATSGATPAVTRATVQNTLVPSQGDQPTVFVNKKGEYTIGMAAVNTEKGASNVSVSGVNEGVTSLGVFEVSKQLHDCRHAGNPPPVTDPVARAAFYADLAAKCKP